MGHFKIVCVNDRWPMTNLIPEHVAGMLSKQPTTEVVYHWLRHKYLNDRGKEGASLTCYWACMSGSMQCIPHACLSPWYRYSPHLFKTMLKVLPLICNTQATLANAFFHFMLYDINSPFVVFLGKRLRLTSKPWKVRFTSPCFPFSPFRSTVFFNWSTADKIRLIIRITLNRKNNNKW